MSRKLFEPLTLRGVTFRNRVWVPPMCQYSAKTDGVATEWHRVHYGSFARGGAGAIIVEATGVTAEGRISPADLGLYTDAQRDALVPIVDFAHSQGAAIGIQLAHAGRKASTYPGWGTDRSGTIAPVDGGWQTVAPSAVAFPGLGTPRALSKEDIAARVEAFVAAAQRAVDAGFDFVEVHGAHGYLVHEFLSPLSNERTDEYGGTLENRARLALEITAAVRAAIPETMPLFVRLSATDWTDGGLTVEETVQVSAWLKDAGADLIDVSSGGNVNARIAAGPGYQVPFATAVREGAGIPVAAVGLITDPTQAEHILVTGQADAVLIGREILRDAAFAIRAARALGAAAPVPPALERAY